MAKVKTAKKEPLKRLRKKDEKREKKNALKETVQI
jgi:hypothetical protein